MAAGAVRVRGLRELNRAFSKLAKDTKKELTGELKKAAEPVRGRAEELAVSRIRNIGSSWSAMRVGATAKMVYVAPRRRRSGGSPRPNLAPLLLERALVPALDEKQGEVIDSVEQLLDRLGNDAGF